MKVSLASVLLLLTILDTASTFYNRPRMPESLKPLPNCCYKYYDKVLPKKRVVGYKEALSCNLPAIIFVTKRNLEVCANPNKEWVKEYIEDPKIPLMPERNVAQSTVNHGSLALGEEGGSLQEHSHAMSQPEAEKQTRGQNKEPDFVLCQP